MRVIIFLIVAGIAGAFLYLRGSKSVTSSIPPASVSDSPSVKADNLENRTIGEQGSKITVNFGQCLPDRRRIDTAFGSTTIMISGKSNDFCVLAYGGEVENPNWNGSLPFKCSVPASMGTAEFVKGTNGVDLGAIGKYCTK